MKKFLSSIFLLTIFVSITYAQITVSGSLRKTSNPLAVEVVAKPSVTTSAQVGNVNIAISIPDQTLIGGTNPTDASITKATTIANVKFFLTTSPYIISGRAYYNYIMLPDLSADIPTTFTANIDNPVATFTFPSNTYFPFMQLNDLSNVNGGPNFQMTWYFQFNQGIGDVTDYAMPFYGAGAVNNAGTAEQFVSLQNAVLPVKFLGFTVTKNNNSAILNWSVESEDANTDKYEILRSSNGVDFQKVATLAAKNNGSSTNNYSFTQDNLSTIRNSGIIYFRIKQIDKDGKSVVTEIKSVRLGSKGLAFGVYPNPIKQIANVNFELEKDTDVILSILDASGKQIMISQLQGFKGVNIKPLDMAKLASGSYLLKVQVGTEIKTMPIVKGSN